MYTYQQVYDASLIYFKGDELAAKVFVDKYALQDADGSLYELTPVEMHRRLAKEFARIEARYPDAMSEETIFDLLKDWTVIPQGSPMSGIGNNFQLQSLSNCFVIQSAEDSYGGIFLADQRQAQIMKRRGGVGHDISNIRPKGMHTKNAARTTDGIGVFLDRFSNTTREVAQNGRRGALMLSISVKHPEVETFINIKRNKTRVTGANISVRVTDDFMRAVKADTTYVQQWPVDAENPSIRREVRARDIWDQMMKAAWESAEPGVLFWDSILKESPADCYADVGYRTLSTNPCIVGDTLIAVADGRNAVAIKDLVTEGKDVPVYSTNTETGQTEIKWGRNPRVTGKNREVWQLTLDDGTTFKATPDHKILTKDLKYTELKDLKVGQSLFPFNSFDSNGYRQVTNVGSKMLGGAHRNRRQYRLIYEFFKGVVDAKTTVIHHRDFDSYNDQIDNLVPMSHKDHKSLHANKMLGKNNPYHTHMTVEWKEKLVNASRGLNNGRAFDITNDQLLDHARTLFQRDGKISKQSWARYAEENHLPRFFGGEYRGTWANFKNQVATNHKVISVEFVGYEDVYNITVDDNHNYHVITSGENDYVISSGFCVKNCGELPLCSFDSCRLLVLNLSKFVNNPFTTSAEFDFARFASVAKKAQRLMDDLVDLELDAIKAIVAKIENDPESPDVKHIELSLWKQILEKTGGGRRTGLGETALGDAIAMLGLKYGSAESIEFTEKVHRALAIASYSSSVEMAKSRGAFPVFSLEKEKDHCFVKRVIDECSLEIQEMYATCGRRNIANLTVAPAGSVSIEAQTTSGGEPVFLLEHTRRKKIVGGNMAKADFVDDSGDRWQEFQVSHPGHLQWAQVNGLDPVKDKEQSPYWGATAHDIDWVKKVEMQAAAQRWIDHSISNTTNIPSDVSVDVVKDIYMRGWESGCKGITIYRDKSRSGVLVESSTKGARPVSSIQETHAPKRPDKLPCDIHRARLKGGEYLILVGMLNNRPYEVFCGLANNMDVGNKTKKGHIIKETKKGGVGIYHLVTDTGEKFENIADLFDNPEFGALTRMVSTSLRHGVPVHYVVEQLRKDKHSDITSFSTVVARVLSKGYIVDGTKSSAEKVCSSCGSSNMAYQQGCVSCLDCGDAKCG